MTNFVFAVCLAIIMLLATVLNKTYHEQPIKELRYKARQGKKPEKTLYKVSAYGPSLQNLLIIITVLRPLAVLYYWLASLVVGSHFL